MISEVFFLIPLTPTQCALYDEMYCMNICTTKRAISNLTIAKQFFYEGGFELRQDKLYINLLNL